MIIKGGGTRRKRPSDLKGFTLIELMIVITIIAILASIAFPSYQESVRKSRRGAAKADLVELANVMERYFTENNTYIGATFPEHISSDYYSYTVTAAPAPASATSTFILSATPSTSSQSSDKCGTMTLNQMGSKTTTGTTGCW